MMTTKRLEELGSFYIIKTRHPVQDLHCQADLNRLGLVYKCFDYMAGFSNPASVIAISNKNDKVRVFSAVQDLANKLQNRKFLAVHPDFSITSWVIKDPDGAIFKYQPTKHKEQFVECNIDATSKIGRYFYDGDNKVYYIAL